MGTYNIVENFDKFKSCKVDIKDLDSEKTSRNANGLLIRDRITVKRTIELNTRPLSADEMKVLLTALSDVTTSITYIDPILGTATKIFYVSDRTAPMLMRDKDGSWLWGEMSFSLIEV